MRVSHVIAEMTDTYEGPILSGRISRRDRIAGDVQVGHGYFGPSWQA